MSKEIQKAVKKAEKWHESRAVERLKSDGNIRYMGTEPEGNNSWAPNAETPYDHSEVEDTTRQKLFGIF